MVAERSGVLEHNQWGWARVHPFVWVLAGTLALWEITPRLFSIPSIVLPPPSQVVVALVKGFRPLAWHAGITFVETLAGFSAGSLVGFLSGIGVFYSPYLRRSLYPLLLGFRIVPKVAFVPLFLVWFGVGLGSKVALSTFAIFFIILVQTVLGLQSVEPEFIELGRSLKMSEFLMFRKIRLPAALPSIMVGVKLGITYALTNVIVAEMSIAAQGLGFLAVDAQSSLRAVDVFSVIVATMVLGLLLYLAGTYLERKTTFWYYQDTGMARRRLR